MPLLITANIGVLLAALGTASVEFFEAGAIAYAIARSGYRFEAIWGVITGLVGVGVLSAAFSSSLQAIPLHWLQIAIGLVLIWFGWGWTKKSVLRQASGQRAGWVADDPLIAEGIALEPPTSGFSYGNYLVMTKSAALETFEVALAVVALGSASGNWTEALLGAGLALLLAVGATLLLHGQLRQVPDVVIKLSAGVLLLAYGSFWLGEGLGVEWPFREGSLALLIALYAGLSLLAIRQIRSNPARAEKLPGPARPPGQSP